MAELGKLAELVAVFPMMPPFPIHELLPQIQVTLDCNSRCSYCFQTRVPGVMSFSVLEAIVGRLVHLYRDTRCPVTMIWHGGEPLKAGLDFFNRIISIQNQYPHVRFKNRIQTNATLMSREFARFFCDHDFEVGVSIDGPRDIHDRHRRLNLHGTGSFSKTMAGIDTYKKAASCGHIPVIAVVTRDSITRAQDLFLFFKSLKARVQIDFYDIRYLDFKFSSAGGDLFRLAPSSREVGTFLIRLFDLWFWEDSDAVDFPELREEVKMILQPELNFGDPYHKKRCSLGRIIFAPDGRVYSCDQYVNDRGTALGHIREDSLETILVRKAELWERIKRVIRGSGSEMACFGCEWGHRHAGGCLTCMKYNSLVLAAREKGLPDEAWGDMDLPPALKAIRGETYYCEGLNMFRRHATDLISKEMARG